MKMKTLILPLAILTFGFTNCEKESTDGNCAKFHYRLNAVNPVSPLGRLATSLRTKEANIRWTAGKASAGLLKFEAESSSGEVEFKQKTTEQIDLFSAGSTLGSISIPAGTYSEVEFKAFLAPSNSAAALELTGSFSTGNSTKTIQFVVSAPVEIKAEKHNVTVTQGASYSALNSLDLSQLTRGVSETVLNNASATNGVVVISASSNTELFGILLKNLNSRHAEAEVEHEQD